MGGDANTPNGFVLSQKKTKRLKLVGVSVFCLFFWPAFCWDAKVPNQDDTILRKNWVGSRTKLSYLPRAKGILGCFRLASEGIFEMILSTGLAYTP